jgi:hypothetical protein
VCSRRQIDASITFPFSFRYHSHTDPLSQVWCCQRALLFTTDVFARLCRSSQLLQLRLQLLLLLLYDAGLQLLRRHRMHRSLLSVVQPRGHARERVQSERVCRMGHSMGCGGKAFKNEVWNVRPRRGSNYKLNRECVWVAFQCRTLRDFSDNVLLTSFDDETFAHATPLFDGIRVL